MFPPPADYLSGVALLREYLPNVSLETLFMVGAIAFLTFVLLPRTRRLEVSIVLTVVWLTLCRMPDLEIQKVARLTSPFPFLLLSAAALLEPGPRCRLPAIAWLWPVLSAASLCFVWTVEDRIPAVAIRLHWFLLTLSAVLVVRTITGRDDLARIWRALTLGVALSLLVPLSAILLRPAEAIREGIGRFFPYAANANQIGVLLVLGPVLCCYAAFSSRRLPMRLLWLGMVAASLGMGLLTVSRSVVVLTALSLVPLAQRLVSRPGTAIVSGSIVVLGVVALIGEIGTPAKFDRLGSLESARYELWREYVDVIADRPFLGLWGTRGLLSTHEPTLGHHPHSAYLYNAYLGGLALTLPMAWITLRSLRGSWAVWRARHRLDAEPLMLTLMGGIFVASVLHGFVNGTIYFPTYSWSWIHVSFSVFFLAMDRSLRGTGHAVAVPSGRLPAWSPGSP